MSFSGDLPKPGDIKSSVSTADHDGWYLLNGRNISALPVNAQAIAVNLGFTTALPDSGDRMIKGKNNAETLAARRLKLLFYTSCQSSKSYFYRKHQLKRSACTLLYTERCHLLELHSRRLSCRAVYQYRNENYGSSRKSQPHYFCSQRRKQYTCCTLSQTSGSSILYLFRKLTLTKNEKIHIYIRPASDLLRLQSTGHDNKRSTRKSYSQQ
jgi:hypothetical protein